MDAVFEAASKLYQVAPNLMGGIWQRLTKNNRWNYQLISRLGFNHDLAEEKDVQMYIKGVNESSFEIFHALLKDYNSFNGDQLLKNIACPTLLVAGEEDHITPNRICDDRSIVPPRRR